MRPDARAAVGEVVVSGSAVAPAPAAAPDAKARFGYYAIQDGDRVTPMSPLRKL